VSLGLLCDSSTQDWGATRFISKEIRGQGGRVRIERKLINVSFKTGVWAQPLVGRRVEPCRATASSTREAGEGTV
jgi:TolB-like protein